MNQINVKGDADLMNNSKSVSESLQQNYYSNFSTNVPKLFGREAFKAQVELSFRAGDRIWLKQGSDPKKGNGRFFVGEVSEDGNFGIRGTKGTGEARVETEFYEDAFEHLADLAEDHDEGIFYIPGKPEEFPLKEYCRESNDIGAEMDDSTEENQRF